MDARIIAFRNGLLNLEDDSFTAFTPDTIITNIIPWDYNPNAYCELTDNMMNNISCNNQEIRLLLEEMVGYCMFRRNELRRAFILTGSGSNGKSTFLNVLKTMLGKRNYSVLDLKKLDDRFSTIMMFGKLANIGDDISDDFVADTAFFKKIVTGETIDAEQKGQPKFDFEPYVKLIFSANNIPRIGKGRDSEAVLNRLVIIPFNAKFKENQDNYSPFIGDDLKSQESMEYMIQLGLAGLKRVLASRKFTKSEQIQKELEEFEETNNPINLPDSKEKSTVKNIQTLTNYADNYLKDENTIYSIVRSRMPPEDEVPNRDFLTSFFVLTLYICELIDFDSLTEKQKKTFFDFLNRLERDTNKLSDTDLNPIKKYITQMITALRHQEFEDIPKTPIAETPPNFV